MMRFQGGPSVPWVEGDEIEAYLAGVGADEAERRFIADLNRDGVAVSDLGPEGAALYDQAIAQTEKYFARSAQDAWRRGPYRPRRSSNPGFVWPRGRSRFPELNHAADGPGRLGSGFHRAMGPAS